MTPFKPFPEQSDEEKLASYSAALLARNDAFHALEKNADAVHEATLDRDRARDERDALQRQLDAILNSRSDAPSTPQEITRRILAGTLQPALAKAALYALQVSLSAKRTEHLIAAQQQKEERLRSQKQRPQEPRPAPPRARSKKKRPTKKRK